MRTDPIRSDRIHPADCRCTFHRRAERPAIFTPAEREELRTDLRFALIGGLALNAGLAALHYAPDVIAFLEVKP